MHFHLLTSNILCLQDGVLGLQTQRDGDILIFIHSIGKNCAPEMVIKHAVGLSDLDIIAGSRFTIVCCDWLRTLTGSKYNKDHDIVVLSLVPS